MYAAASCLAEYETDTDMQLYTNNLTGFSLFNEHTNW